MQKTVTKTIATCDFCGDAREFGCDSCLKCGKDICWECKKTKAVEYRHSVHCMGSGDGTYCLSCNASMEAQPDELFIAYQKIAALRSESKRFYEDFEIRTTLAESQLKKAQEPHRWKTTT